MQPKVILKPEEHRGQRIVIMQMPKDAGLISIAKRINGKWSATKKVWWVLNQGNVVNTIYEAFKNVAYVDYSAFKQDQNVAPCSEAQLCNSLNG